jgi:hypothetical protein
MKNKFTPFLMLLLSILFLATSCKKEEQVVSPPLPGNEFLTTIKLHLISSDNLDTLVATWRDLTPEDTNPPDTSLASLILKSNTTYSAHLELMDETKSPSEDITAEIQERANYHRIFYFPSSSLETNLSVAVTDLDTNNPPLALGISSTISTQNVSSGFLQVILKHQPNVKDGTFAPGSTDADVKFQISIQP